MSQLGASIKGYNRSLVTMADVVLQQLPIRQVGLAPDKNRLAKRVN
jgi:hypothetical protein